MTGKTLGAANEGAGRGKESSVPSCHAGEVLRNGDLPCAPSRADGALSTWVPQGLDVGGWMDRGSVLLETHSSGRLNVCV